jgi:SAM-dependent methyltransferase
MEFRQNTENVWVPVSATNELVSYPEEGNEVFFNLEEKSQWFNARNRTITWMLKRFPFKGAFVDVGGGNGYQLSFLQQHVFENGIESALCEPGYVGCKNSVDRGVKNVYCATAKTFPFNQYQAGAIGLFDVIEHIEDDAAFVRSIGERVDSGTRFYITVPALESLRSKEDDYAGHYRRYNQLYTNNLVRSTGFKLIYQSYLFFYYVPLVWLARVLPEKLGKVPTQEELVAKEKGHHEQPKLLNALLNVAHDIEQVIRRFGFKPLFGTSRLIILEKP